MDYSAFCWTQILSPLQITPDFKKKQNVICGNTRIC